MKNYLLPAFALFAVQGLYAQIENGNFDNWVEKETYQQPVMEVETTSSNSEIFFIDGSLNVTPVDGPDGTALRLETVEVSGEMVPGFFITGSVPVQQGEGLIFGGGVATVDPNVTGLSFSIRHDIDANSPGFVIVQFKANGVPVGEGNMGPGSMMIPLVGVSDWHEVDIEFENGFETNPTECVFAVATNDLLGDDQSFSLGSFVEVDNLNFISTSEDEVDIIEDGFGPVYPGPQKFTGGNFENWTDVAPVFIPEGVLVEMAPFETKFERTEDAHSGAYALALRTTGGVDAANPTSAVFAEGELENPVPNIEINESHNAVSFSYKFEAENDLAGAVIRFFNQTESGEFEEVLEKEFILSPTDEYTEIVFNFQEEMEAILPIRGSISEVTHMTIEFNSGIWSEGNTPKAGSVLKVDAVELSGSLRASILKISTPEVIAYPNPATQRVQFKFKLPRSGYYRVYNAAGVEVDVKQFNSTQYVAYDFSQMRSGLYLFNFQHNAGVDAVRVIVQ